MVAATASLTPTVTGCATTGPRPGAGCGQGFVDENGDGVCDNWAGTWSGGGQGGYGAGYVDTDGDGICDNWENGTGCGCGYCNGAGQGAGGGGYGYVDADGDGVCDNYENGTGGQGYGYGAGNGGGGGYVDADGDGGVRQLGHRDWRWPGLRRRVTEAAWATGRATAMAPARAAARVMAPATEAAWVAAHAVAKPATM